MTRQKLNGIANKKNRLDDKIKISITHLHYTDQATSQKPYRMIQSSIRLC